MVELPAADHLPDCVFIEDAAVCIGNTVCACVLAAAWRPRGYERSKERRIALRTLLLRIALRTLLKMDGWVCGLNQIMLTRPGAVSREGEVAELHRTLNTDDALAAARKGWSIVRMEVRRRFFVCAREPARTSLICRSRVDTILRLRTPEVKISGYGSRDVNGCLL
jgi:N-dimethylarginine dimethylaminohydrolase